MLKKLGAGCTTLIVVDQYDENLDLSARNLPNVAVMRAAEVDVINLLYFRTLVASKAGFEALTAAGESEETVQRAHETRRNHLQSDDHREAAHSSLAKNKYMLEVAPGANKIEIRKAVEAQFGMCWPSILKNYQGAQRTLKNRRVVPGAIWKRAIVTVRAGERIEIV